MRISKRILRDSETDILVRQLRDFPHVGWVSASGWRKVGDVYVATEKQEFVGICRFVVLPHWIKLGPFVVTKKFQGKGYGGQLLKHVIDDLKGNNLYIGSSNPVVGKLALQNGFQRESNYLRLPGEIQRYLIAYLFERLNSTFIRDQINKQLTQIKGKLYYYYLNPTSMSML